jgi:hypothetical protein
VLNQNDRLNPLLGWYTMSNPKEVGEPINFGGMVYAPVNELGVVCLFGAISKMLGYHIERIQTHFPDCFARKQGRPLSIEFEYKASKFKRDHYEKGEKCDAVICWEDDWPDKPKNLEIVELKGYVGCSRRIWLFSVGGTNAWKTLDQMKSLQGWTCRKKSRKGDLVLWWRKTPESTLKDLWEIKSKVRKHAKLGLVADMKLVGRLRTPLTIEHLKQDNKLKRSSFVRGSFQKGYEVTRYWADLYRLVTKLNPEMKSPLLEYFRIA